MKLGLAATGGLSCFTGELKAGFTATGGGPLSSGSGSESSAAISSGGGGGRSSGTTSFTFCNEYAHK